LPTQQSASLKSFQHGALFQGAVFLFDPGLLDRTGLKLQPTSLPIEFVPQQAVVKKRRLARLDVLEAAVRQRGFAPEQQGPR